jgi:hypothetical protein
MQQKCEMRQRYRAIRCASHCNTVKIALLSGYRLPTPEVRLINNMERGGMETAMRFPLLDIQTAAM